LNRRETLLGLLDGRNCVLIYGLVCVLLVLLPLLLHVWPELFLRRVGMGVGWGNISLRNRRRRRLFRLAARDEEQACRAQD
jgi:hypothetical protein